MHRIGDEGRGGLVMFHVAFHANSANFAVQNDGAWECALWNFEISGAPFPNSLGRNATDSPYNGTLWCICRAEFAEKWAGTVATQPHPGHKGRRRAWGFGRRAELGGSPRFSGPD